VVTLDPSVQTTRLIYIRVGKPQSTVIGA
jgi:hypothetical protein